MNTPSGLTADASAVSWGAVLAGAVGAAAFSLILFLLGTGIGLSVISPWSREGTSGTAVAASTIVWITFVQLLASVLGGYLAGRLRTRWVTVHTNEVFFRDTAHGFLAWSVATLLMATLLSSAVGSALSTGAKATGAVAATAAASVGAAGAAAAGENSLGYYVDTMLRPGGGDTASSTPPAPVSPARPDEAEQVSRILTHAIEAGELSSTDSAYLGQRVAATTGLSQADAERRVSETFARLQQSIEKAKKVADDARKASAYTALWLVVSLLVGAFVASLAATFGGRLRDSSVLAHR